MMRRILLFLTGCIFVAPVLVLVSGSLMSRFELGEYLGALETGEGFVGWTLSRCIPPSRTMGVSFLRRRSF